MAKDSYWFKHDSTAGRGTRMRKMAFVYGHWGKGIYWDVIELLRDQSNYCFPKSEFDLKMLADLIGCKDETKFLNWYADCVKFELFIEQETTFFSEVLCVNMQKWEVSKTNGNQGGRPKNNLNETKPITQTKPKTKPKRNHKRREYKIIVDKKKVDKSIPSIEDFYSYALENKPTVDYNLLKLKYNSWVENDWADGNNNKIINWKSKLLNTLPFIAEGQPKEVKRQVILQYHERPKQD